MSNYYSVPSRQGRNTFSEQSENNRGFMMNKDAIKMINMAQSISKINGWEILRMDLQKCTMGNIQYYVLYMVYEGNREITIRNDCTVVGYDD